MRGNMSSNKLVRVVFRDHVIFRNHRPRTKPIIRETVGWLFDENDESITLLWVREPEKSSPQVRRHYGICILKSDIVKVEEVEVGGEAKEMEAVWQAIDLRGANPIP